MAGTLYGFPFDEEIFSYRWQTDLDPTLTALLESGVLREDAEIANLISNGSNTYTLPFYKDLDGVEQNYDGATDILSNPTSADVQTGVVWGRNIAWVEKDFTYDFNSGASPMDVVYNRVAKHRARARQKRLIGILKAIFGVEDVGFAEHTTDLTTKTTEVTDANKMGADTALIAMQKAIGDKADFFSLAIMHSSIARRLKSLEVLEYRKQTDALGIQRTIALADYNGRTVIVDDGVPTAASASATGATEYTTYLFGEGAIGRANAPLKKNLPIEIARDAKKNGGQDELITRYRETMHPYGFSFNLANEAVVNKVSPTDDDLANTAAWTKKQDHKNIYIARILTNG